MPIVKCIICSNEFYTKPSQQVRGWGKYCSAGCRTKSQFKGSTFNCFICEKKIYRSPLAIKKCKSKNFFCSKTCQTIWRNTVQFSGKNHANWKHGISTYRRMLENSKKKRYCVLCKIIDKRVLIVHHKDKNRKNNDISNLVWLCQNCHYLVHHFAETKGKLLSLNK